jgi:carbon storage regulator CsrA
MEGREGLVLERRAGEQILIGADIIIEVDEICRRRRTCKLRIKAPQGTSIWRMEIVKRRESEDGTAG